MIKVLFLSFHMHCEYMLRCFVATGLSTQSLLPDPDSQPSAVSTMLSLFIFAGFLILLAFFLVVGAIWYRRKWRSQRGQLKSSHGLVVSF